MTKTKIQKAIALAGIIAITATSSLGVVLNNTFAATQIGTGSVSGDAGFDSAVMWDDLYNPGTATGIVSGIVITAQVLPTLNMELSTGAIDLGVLDAGIESNWTLGIEVGTNASNGVSITARSSSGGLTNIADGSLKIQDNQDVFDDGNDESYTFASTALAIDSTVTGFAPTGDLAAIEVNNNTDEHIIYTTNKPELDDNWNYDVNFTVAATSNAQTAAGDYQDTITFTVSGNF